MTLERRPTSSMTLMNESQTPTQPISRESCLLEGIRELYASKLFSDVIITVASRQFECHKSILAICSPFFMAMFSSNMREMRQERVEIKEISARTMELVLDYIYTGEVKYDEDTVQHLLSAANMFQLIALRNGCEEFMMNHITAVNCIGVYFFAKAHQCEKLAGKSKDMINEKFAELCHEQEFLFLPCDKLIQIIQDDAINVDREEIIYEACLAWLHYDLANRRRYLSTVLRHVRFANISLYYFCDVIDTSQLLRESEEIQNILSLVKYRHMLKDRQAEVDLNLVPRQGMPYERGVLIMANPYHDDYTRKYNSLEVLLPHTCQVKHLCKLPHSVFMPGACVTGNNQIYLAGGAKKKSDFHDPLATEEVTAKVFMFDELFGSWQVKANMNFARSQFALVLVDGLIYAVGGQSSHNLLDVVERYNPATNQWTVLSPLPKKLRCMTAVSYKGRLYCFGGETETEITKSAYRYDVSEDCWIELPSMHVARALAGCVVYRDTIYVIGGNSLVSLKWKQELLPEHCTNTVEIFDPVTETWSFGPEMPSGLCGAGIIKYSGTILAVGGEDDKCWMVELFILKKEDGKEFWAKGRELSGIMSTFACGVANIPKELYHGTGL